VFSLGDCSLFKYVGDQSIVKRICDKKDDRPIFYEQQIYPNRGRSSHFVKNSCAKATRDKFIVDVSSMDCLKRDKFVGEAGWQ